MVLLSTKFSFNRMSLGITESLLRIFLHAVCCLSFAPILCEENIFDR